MLEINVNVKVEGLDGLAEAIRMLSDAAWLKATPAAQATESEPKKPSRKKKAEEKPEVTAEEGAEPTSAPEAKPVVIKPAETEQSKSDAAMLYKLSEAGASLLEAGKMQDLIALLHTFHVEAVTMLKPEQYDEFARGLRGLGAMI